MEWDEIGNLGGVPIRTPIDQNYRLCTQCGAECQHESTAIERLGIRGAFVCSKHGVNTLVDPFEA